MNTQSGNLLGVISTLLFVAATLPMILKAWRTHDMRSYSLGNLLLVNVGNVLHAVYLLHLPPGPIRLLHGYNLLVAAMMLIAYLRFEAGPVIRRRLDEYALWRNFTRMRKGAS
jgi:hypothetical protein